ncbi:DUF493 family protein [Aureibacter tunicatorum]|uniref:DUF493 domain-containing protein n=1 Tax=Aureibacter tunicatorum TaxID=866807 RepID=A0AAE3XJK4_9BACT|nr:DUF493 family protein [Aureibacter tunicatorum]MDR6237635.1 hypothetical protein [Aureibacter tunicatorum]BDD02670.1 hypothetical protein AUTU_01530 [Aureibacter tunicatorum]
MTYTDPSIVEFKKKLEEQHSFPGDYVFKFIVANDKVGEVENLLPNASWSKRPSKNGKYVSMTTKHKASSSEIVIDTYINAKKIEGIISL